MAINSASQQDTYDHVFGAGIPSHYEWWINFEDSFEGYDAPDGWTVTVTYEAPDTEERLNKVISHADIMRAARKIAEGKSNVVEQSLIKQCRNLVFNVDAADLDANDADAVLQVAVMGNTYFG